MERRLAGIRVVLDGNSHREQTHALFGRRLGRFESRPAIAEIVNGHFWNDEAKAHR